MEKWQWMMAYCKEKCISPATTWAWREAEQKYNAIQNSKQLGIQSKKNSKILSLK